LQGAFRSLADVHEEREAALVGLARAAVKKDGALAALRPLTAPASGINRPAAKPSQGLDAALSARIGHEEASQD
jgi:hypothetical protein